MRHGPFPAETPSAAVAAAQTAAPSAPCHRVGAVTWLVLSGASPYQAQHAAFESGAGIYEADRGLRVSGLSWLLEVMPSLGNALYKW